MKSIYLWIPVIVLLILHQDYWQWDRNELVYGFLPYTLAYNMGISLGTAALWIIVCTFMWPTELDQVLPDSRGSNANQPGDDR